MTSFLDAVKSARESAPAGQGGGSTVYPPDGAYNMTCVSYSVKPTNAGDKIRLSLKLVVDHGPHNGTGGWASHSLDRKSEQNLRIFLKLLDAFGISIEEVMSDISDDDTEILEKVGKLAQQRRVQGKVQTRDNRQEVRYVNPLPANAPASQRQAASAGMAAVAAASKPKAKAADGPAAAGPKRPSF